MHYFVPCECGKNVAVAATQAGCMLRCECGRSLTVPPLSGLRALAGQEAYRPSTIALIARMIRNGELPWGDTCALSGRPTKDAFVLQIECERVWTRGSGLDSADRAFIGFLFFGWIGLFVGWGKAEKPRHESGRETVIEVLLRVCSEFHDKLQRRRQRYLKSLLRQVPVYATLLDEYPGAVVAPVRQKRDQV